MAQYFFKMSQAERNNILDQHKTIYDGYVTQFAQESNTQPLYVQDYANDKGGITLSNNGNVTTYKNVGINESIDRRDRIGDGPNDLKNGTVDLDSEMDRFETEFPSPNENEFDYVSLGNTEDECRHCDDDSLGVVIDINSDFSNMEEMFEDDVVDSVGSYEYDIDEPEGFESQPMNFDGDVDEENLPEFMEKLNESLDMFKRFKKYN